MNRELGVVLIVIGTVLLLWSGMGWLMEHHGWALFMLLPGVLLGVKAYRGYREAGQLTPRVASRLSGAMPLVLVSSLFLFGLDFGRVWPLFLILAGTLALLRNHVEPKTYEPE